MSQPAKSTESPPQPTPATSTSAADSDDDDGPVQLSADLLAMLSPEARSALSSHLAEKAASEAAAAKLKADGGTEIGEDFGMSQFWYTDECAEEMAREMIDAVLERTKDAEAKVRIACISAPSAFKALKRINHPRVQPFVLEYDRRFAAYGPEFVFYDFNFPSAVASTYSDQELGGPLRKSFDGIIADPPYLNEECMSKTGETIRILAKSPLKTPVMFNTGAILRKPIALVLNCHPCVKRPKHRVAIMNPFLTYTNYEAKSLGGWEKEE